MMQTPRLSTLRLTLRPVYPNDIDFIYTLFKRSETNKYSEFPDIETKKEAIEMYEKYMKPGNESHFRLIIENLNHTSMGTIGLYNYSINHRRAEIGYDLLKEYWGLGIMSEAVKAIVEYGFDELNLVRVEATVDTENIGSIRVLEKNGFVLEGCRVMRYYYREKWHDEACYAIIKHV
jgi:ribosomal-protein-alanine N-acetyltransferase